MVKSGDFQRFNGGVVEIYCIINGAEAGDMPAEKPVLRHRLRFGWKTVGINRYYSAMQNMVKISRAIIAPLMADVSTQDIAVINGQQYRIEQKQELNDYRPPSMLLALSDIEEVYEL